VLLTQYYLGCLSHASYLIGDERTGRAAVVDPQRDVASYLDDAATHGLEIEHVIETHVHADFVSGHLELAAATGADICFGPGVDTDFDIRTLRDGDRLELGDVVLEVRETPGHTPESISVVVWERPDAAAPHAVLTGDTLFVGDVGRPDLTADDERSPEDMARLLFRSVHDKLLTLPDATRVLPAHGAGSACGKNLSTETSSTIGEQRRSNHALLIDDEETFVAVITEGQPTSPHYFGYDAHRNREARPLLDEATTPERLTLDDVLARQGAGAVVIDTRPAQDFGRGHLRGAVNVGLEGRFAEYAGDVLDPETPVVVVADAGRELEARVRLARIGFDNVVGSLADPIEAFLAHPEHVVVSSWLRADELADRLRTVPGLTVVDVRNPAEVEAGSIEGSIHLPLPGLVDHLDDLDPTAPTVVYCAGGYRSSVAASLLASRGWADVSELLGGFAAWEAQQGD
jgi:glyoxylase-like metal-dependent hydrolase (beta-lactamase superfamily II)